MMSGEIESKTLNERRARVERLIAEYCEKVSLGKLQPVNEVEPYLNASPSLLKNMTPEDCGIAAVVLARAASYIQLEINRTQADINWCEKYITYLISSAILNMQHVYATQEYKRCVAIQNNDVAKELDTIINAARIKLDTLMFLPSYLKEEAQTFLALQQTKRIQK